VAANWPRSLAGELERGQADKYAHGWALPANKWGTGNAYEYQASVFNFVQTCTSI
jgi:hypothetical protein